MSSELLKDKNGREILARNLLALADDHREKCDGDCGISLSLVGVIYEWLLEKPLTEDEIKKFW